jgi:hypothetical protein
LWLISTAATRANLNQGIVSTELDPKEGSTVTVLPWIGVGIAKEESRELGNIFTAQFCNLFEAL